MSEKKVGLIPDVTMGLLVPKLYDLVISTERLVLIAKKPRKGRDISRCSRSVSDYDFEGLDSLASRSGSISVVSTSIVHVRLENTARRPSELGMLNLRIGFISRKGKAKILQAIMNPSLDFIRSKVSKPDRSRMAEQFRFVQVEYAKMIRDMLTQVLPPNVSQSAEWLI